MVEPTFDGVISKSDQSVLAGQAGPGLVRQSKFWAG